jgi:hypothetical protein
MFSAFTALLKYFVAAIEYHLESIVEFRHFGLRYVSRVWDCASSSKSLIMVVAWLGGSWDLVQASSSMWQLPLFEKNAAHCGSKRTPPATPSHPSQRR